MRITSNENNLGEVKRDEPSRNFERSKFKVWEGLETPNSIDIPCKTSKEGILKYVPFWQNFFVHADS